jgi:hypothetical protein
VLTNRTSTGSERRRRNDQLPELKERAMSDDDIRRLDDTTLLLLRQAAADCGDEKRLLALDAEVIRRTALIRAQLGGGR